MDMAKQQGRRALTATLFLVGLYLIYKVSKVEGWNDWCWAFLFLMTLDVTVDRKDVSWLKFLPLGLLAVGIPYLVYRNAPALWWAIANWQTHNGAHLWNWNNFMASVPGNDGEYFRTGWPFKYLQYPRMHVVMEWIYNYGFSMSIWVSVIRSYLARDARKAVRYALSTHFLQYPLIMPLYSLILLQEVWFVQGWADPLGRHVDHNTLLVYVQNCFPSMHTSVSFAILLLALREKAPIFKWGMVAYCTAIVFSTQYLGIHWFLDLPAGALLGWGCVKISDLLLNKFWPERADERMLRPVPGPLLAADTRVSV